jgi:hypothetical protein
MDTDIKKYADTLYESARMDSAKALSDSRVKNATERAARNTGNLPLSGIDIQAVAKVYDAYIERCMTARFESYEQAFFETGRVPSEQDFTDILNDCKAARELALKQSTRTVREFVGSRGGGSVTINTDSLLGPGSTYGHDRVLQRWKVWKAKTQLRPSTIPAEERIMESDALRTAPEERPMASSKSHVSNTTGDDLLIFVSHSSKDKALAETLTDLLKSALGLLSDQIRCSSVDGHRLPVGVDTQNKLREEVHAAKVVIGLVTPSSLASSYVMFELGARWGAGLFLAPLLAGVKPSG